jgi:hypothetical protein
LLDWIRRSLPVRLHDWAERQPPGTQARLLERVQCLRELVSGAEQDPAQSTELFRMLGLRLVYEPRSNAVQVRTEVLRGAVMQGTIEL